MKKLITITGCVLLLLAACSSDKHKEQHSAAGQKYTCPMHPQVVQEAPGTCPICHMDLVPLQRQGEGNELVLTESQEKLANIQTTRAGEGTFSSSKVLNAKIVTDPGLTEVISSRYTGRIEKLYVKETGAGVSKGQPLLLIYSEQLQTLQQDYLLQLKQQAAFPSEKIYQDMKKAAENKLRLYGFSDAQIRALAAGKNSGPLITVYSPATGVVSELNVSEGQYLAEGSQVMKLDNYGSLWAEADIYPSEASEVRQGMEVRIAVNGLPGSEQRSEIIFAGPEINAASQIITIRAPLKNPGNVLQPGMGAVMFLSGKASGGVKLPLNAVIRDGKGAHVWVKTGDHTFVPKMVQTGAEDDRQILISAGLADGDEIVTSGAYLLYSDFVLKKGADPMAAHHH